MGAYKVFKIVISVGEDERPLYQKGRSVLIVAMDLTQAVNHLSDGATVISVECLGEARVVECS